MTQQIRIYDTTLRDGEQAESISFSLDDKMQIARLLDELGVHYIEGGQAESNPKVMEFFKEISKFPFKNAKLVAFGMTRRKNTDPDQDANLATMLGVGTPACALFGKCWDLHVIEALRTTLDENLLMIADSVRFFKKHGRELIFDAEHFFDGYKADPDYALKTLAAADEAGADALVLCDTNGGCLPHEIAEIVSVVRQSTTTEIGIHVHNDSGLATANSLMAVHCGATHVQGTMNGYGERTGNADLITVIPSLMLKMGLQAIPVESLRRLTEFSHMIDEIANQTPNPRQPFVGHSAFAHKGGPHVSAMQRHPKTYEHIDPAEVGNQRHVLVSELSGKSNILYKMAEQGMDLNLADEQQKMLLDRVKVMENEGYSFEAADASFQVLASRISGAYKRAFHLEGFRVIVEKRGHDEDCITEATVKIIANGNPYLMAAEGHGPINALDKALRQALVAEYPELDEVELQDYKVRVLNAGEGTASKVRVLIESGDGHKQWGTVGVSENIIEASWRALVDSLDYKLMEKGRGKVETP